MQQGTTTTSSNSNSTNSMIPILTVGIAITATLSAFALSFVQTDFMSRFVLTKESIRMKRWMEYQYHWQTYITHCSMKLLYYVRDDIRRMSTSGSRNSSMNTSSTSSSTNYLDADDDIEKWMYNSTKYMFEKDEIQFFCDHLVSSNTSTTSTSMIGQQEQVDNDTEDDLSVFDYLQIAQIAYTDSSASTNNDNNHKQNDDHPFNDQQQLLMIWFVDIRYADTDTHVSIASTPNSTPRTYQNITIWYQLPLYRFIRALSISMEKSSSSLNQTRATTAINTNLTTFCFIYDAAGNQGSQFLLQWIHDQQQQPQENNKNNRMMVGQIQPLWLTQLIVLLQQQQISILPSSSSQQHQQQSTTIPSSFSSSSLTEMIPSIVYTLFQYELIFLQKQQHIRMNKIHTLCITISMSFIPILLPILHSIFPNERHAFIYSTAIQTITTLLLQQQQKKKNSRIDIIHHDYKNDHDQSSPNQQQQRPRQGRRIGFHQLPNSLQEALTCPWYIGSPINGSIPLVPVTKLNTTNHYTNNNYHNNNTKLSSSSSSFLERTTTSSATTNTTNINNNPHLMVSNFLQTTSSIPIHIASILESWMSAIDVYLNMKLHDDKKNQFIPYVCRWDYLFDSSSSSMVSSSYSIEYSKKNDDAKDNKDNNNNSNNSSEYWAVRSLLQYITGSRTREMSSNTIDSALALVVQQQQQYQYQSKIQSLVEYYGWSNHWFSSMLSIQGGGDTRRTTTTTSTNNNNNNSYISSMLHYRIKQVVFTHKLILIENKILMDTVQPAQHWTLKAAIKRGCACCLPNEEEENDDDGNEQNVLTTTTKMTISNSTTKRKSLVVSKSGYVDGKLTFAFDPTRFS